jgi:hypothetical protein
LYRKTPLTKTISEARNGSGRELSRRRKLSIRSVSNQPGAGDLYAALSAAQDVLKRIEAHVAQVQAANLLGQLTPQDQAIIRSVQTKAGRWQNIRRICQTRNMK